MKSAYYITKQLLLTSVCFRFLAT